MQTVVYSPDWISSPYYSLFYNGQYTDEKIQFIKALPGLLQMDATSRILDAACGDGYAASFLSHHSREVTGIDFIEKAVNEAIHQQKDNLHFAIHDLRLPFLSNYFDIVLNLFGRFGHYRTVREYVSAIRTMATCLRPGGMLLLDHVNTAWARQQLQAETVMINDKITLTASDEEDRQFFYTKIKIADPTENEALFYKTEQAKFSLADFTFFFENCGLSLRQAYGDYDLSAYNETSSPRLILIAQKLLQDGGDKKKRLYSDGRTTDALT